MTELNRVTLAVPGSDLDNLCRYLADNAPPLTVEAEDLLRTQLGPSLRGEAAAADVVPLPATESRNVPGVAA